MTRVSWLVLSAACEEALTLSPSPPLCVCARACVVWQDTLYLLVLNYTAGTTVSLSIAGSTTESGAPQVALTGPVPLLFSQSIAPFFVQAGAVVDISFVYVRSSRTPRTLASLQHSTSLHITPHLSTSLHHSITPSRRHSRMRPVRRCTRSRVG